MQNKHPKILFCMHMPPPVHGAAVVGKQIYESKLIRDSFDCSYINVSTSASLDEVGRFSLKKITRTLTFLLHVLNTVKKEQPDLVYFTPSTSGWAFYRDVLTIQLFRCRKQNIVLHLHNKPTDAFLHKWYNRRLWKNFFDGVSAIFLGKALAKQFDVYTPLCKNVYICPNGMPDKAGDVHTHCNDTDRPFTFLFLSNMIETKGVYVLLEACALLKKKGYDFRCNFVGQWFDVTRDAFEARCKELSVFDYVHAYGAKYGAEKEEFLRSSDALIFPTFYQAECFPLVLIEAMHNSLPVITTDEGAIQEMIDDGKTGWLIEKNNVEDLELKLQWMLLHPKEGLQMGCDGRIRYERYFTLEQFEKRLSNILNSCVGQQFV